MCKLEILIKMMCILASIFSVIAIATQRYLNISSSTSARNVQSSGPRTLLVIIVIWIVSILIALPLAIWRTYQERQWKDYLEVKTEKELQNGLNFESFSSRNGVPTILLNIPFVTGSSLSHLSSTFPLLSW